MKSRRLITLGGICFALYACGGGKSGNVQSSDSGTPDAGTNTTDTPSGFAVAPGFKDDGTPQKCDNVTHASCSGACVSVEADSNNCRALGISLIFRDMVRDANGIYVSQQGFTHSEVDSLDPATGALVPLATPEGSNDYVHIALTDSSLYFSALDTLYSIPRAGGSTSTVLASLGKFGQMLVVGQRLFVNETSTRPLAEIDMASGELTEHTLSVTGMVRDGSDIYFTQADGTYVAPSADFSSVKTLLSGKSTLLGVMGDWVYVVVGSEVQRLPKTGGDTQAIMAVDAQGKVALASDALVFTRSASDRVYVCTAGLDGTHPTIHGYLPTGVPSLLGADAHHIYAVQGFYMLRFGR